MNVIEINQLCKSYGTVPVLHDVQFSVPGGSLTGFLGPNGAGKTTTIRILLDLLRATSGTTNIFGKPSREMGRNVRAEIGYLPGDVHMYQDMTGLNTLRFLAGARRRNCDNEIKRLSSRFNLDLKKIVRKYSTGMRQKLGLIQALMHQPKLLILDEPTNGLDPLVRNVVFDELRAVVKEGRTVLFSSHSLSEVEELCDEVIILRNGRIVEHQQISVLKQRALRRVEFALGKSSFEGNSIQLPDNVQLIAQDQEKYRCTWTGKAGELLEWLQSIDIEDVIIERPDLNDLFITYYTESKPGVGA